MATLGVTFSIPYLMTRGGSSKATNTPPINASSKDEEKFIQEFLQSVEQEEKKNKVSGKEAH
ncbi:hypothetical protein HRR78_004188 [Exophiala dermatitidis]|nr:hypothetical protein HRR75_005142 [Exophiala dermatitidis]KAJ4550419.1 hypothetical protein HRR78_004188 [Exophiala dermatitidis]